MTIVHRLSLVSLGCAVAAGLISAGVTARSRAEIVRTVYFSAVDAKGEPVGDLAAADVSVKENGKDRAIASLTPAAGPLQIMLLVDDGGTGRMQASVARFLVATRGQAEYGIALLNPQPSLLTNFVTDATALQGALSQIVERGRVQQDGQQLAESVSWAARELHRRNAARPAIVAITNGGEAVSDAGRAILADLKDSGAPLNIVYINGVSFGRVMSDGTKQSGGLLLPANSTQMLSDALTRIAANLTRQYAVKYTLPDGTKPNERFELKTTKAGVTLLAPTRIPDK